MTTTTSTQPRKKRGCFFYGCITAVVLFILMIATVYGVYRFLVGKLVEYTAEKPVEIPVLKVEADKLKEIEKKVDEFSDAYEKGQEGTIVLTDYEINALVGNSSKLKDLRNHVFVTIDNDMIRGEFSAPLKELPLKRVQNRYFNGAASFKVGMKNGKLELYMQSMEINGKKVDEKKTGEMVKQNLMQGFYQNPDNARKLENLKHVEVKDGKLYITTKARTNPSAPDPAPVAPPK